MPTIKVKTGQLRFGGALNMLKLEMLVLLRQDM